MFRKSRSIEQFSYLEDMVADLRYDVENLKKRIQVLEERAVKEDIKSFNSSKTAKKVGRPRREKKLPEKITFGRTTERAALAEIAKYEKQGYTLGCKRKVADGYNVWMELKK